MRQALVPIIALLVSATLGGCERREPPGAEPREARPWVVEAQPPPSAAQDEASSSVEASQRGSALDNLPFRSTGQELASKAWRTWIYTDTGPRRTRYGYLRAGAVVDARGPAIVNEGCEGGWYRINPRGFVCIGKGATLEPEEPLIKSLAARPERGKGLPYRYVMADEHHPPNLYFRLPTAEEMREVEGDGIARKVVEWRVREKRRGGIEALGEITDPPPFLSTQVPLEKPYGVKSGLHYAAHAGQASPESGFALTHVFDWEGRTFGLTTDLDVIPLDRTEVVVPSRFHGVELLEGETLPVGVVRGAPVGRHAIDEDGQLQRMGSYQHREWVKLTGQKSSQGVELWETRDGGYVSPHGLRLINPRDSYPSFATGTRKWIDVSIRHQTLVAYVGRRPVYVTLVSTGRGGMGDPEKAMATIRGTFMVHAKHVSATMDGDEDRADSYALKDVPFVQYFHKGFALHGTYWHDEFGKVRSHGCVNLSPQDAAWLFEWTDPVVPPRWHCVLNKERGTVVYIHG